MKTISRRAFLASGATLGTAAGFGSRVGLAHAPGLPQRLDGVAPGLPQRLDGVAPAQAGGTTASAIGTIEDIALVNGKIHTMDGSKRVVSQALIRNGRFTAVGNNAASARGGLKVIDLKGHTVVPGLIEAHDHIVLVGNRP